MPPMRELSANTKFYVSIGTVVAAVGAAGAGLWKAQATLTDIRDSVKDVGNKVVSLEQSTDDRFRAMESVMADRFTKTAAAEWALRTQLANPTLRITDPRDPSHFLTIP